MNVEAWQQTPSGKPRARAFGVPFQGRPGPLNAITDVAGVRVGYSTLVAGDSVRTGVTAIIPRPADEMQRPVWAGMHVLNGNGEMSGMAWIGEVGGFAGPITLTNTHSCGLARDATIRWMSERYAAALGRWMLPVASETYDGLLNDINGFHVREEHVFAALDEAAGGRVEEGSVGGGTGMVCFGYKGGSGTASRLVEFDGRSYTVGVFVQANFGLRRQLVVAGVPVGQMLVDEDASDDRMERERGSLVAIIATDAPLLPHQLSRLARRGGLGIGRCGSAAGHSSGDIFLALSTANGAALERGRTTVQSTQFVPDWQLDPMFEAVIQATDEAVLNAIFGNRTMVGIGGRTVDGLPGARVRQMLRSKL